MSNHPTDSATAIIAAVAVLFLAAVSGQAPASAPLPYMGGPASPVPMPPAPSPGGLIDVCMNNLLNMSDCLSYVVQNSTEKVPDPNCCPELAGLVDSSPQCLCLLFGDTSSYGISIDLKRALNLPSVCKVVTPDVSLCSAFGYPVPGPTSAVSPVLPPTSPGGEAPGGAAASPTTGNEDGNGASGIVAASAVPTFFAASAVPTFFAAFAFTLLLTFF